MMFSCRPNCPDCKMPYLTGEIYHYPPRRIIRKGLLGRLKSLILQDSEDGGLYTTCQVCKRTWNFDWQKGVSPISL